MSANLFLLELPLAPHQASNSQRYQNRSDSYDHPANDIYYYFYHRLHLPIPLLKGPAAEVEGHADLDTFMSINPLTMSAAAIIRSALAGSPRKKIPTTNAPTAPIPVHSV